MTNQPATDPNASLRSASSRSRKVPNIAFFGTRGGVGKTTIMDKFGALIVRSESGPNVLMVDFDVHHRGLTVLRTADVASKCPSIHDYIVDSTLAFSSAHDITPIGDPMVRGRQLLIPSSALAATQVFDSIARTDPATLLARIRKILSDAIERYRIDVVLIDCGPIVDPLTASAAFNADMAFIIGQNEPITFQSLMNYVRRIQDFYPDYSASSVRVLLNKVRGTVTKRAGIYGLIPFTMEVIDVAEGIEGIDEVRMSLLDHRILTILNDVLHTDYPHLIPPPEVVLPPELRAGAEAVEGWPQTRWFRRMWGWVWGLLVTGLLTLSIGAMLMFGLARALGLSGSSDAGSIQKLQPWELWVGLGLTFLGASCLVIGGRAWMNARSLARIVALKRRGGLSAITDLVGTSKGRQQLDAIRHFTKRHELENKR